MSYSPLFETWSKPYNRLVTSWFETCDHLAASVVEANRATLSAYGAGDSRERASAPIPSLAYREPTWSFERTVDDPAHITVGDAVWFTKVVDDDDVHAFALASGDTNRLHLDDGFAEGTRFEERIVHGTLVSGLISAALARLPGLTIYLSQDLRFLRPVSIGERLMAVVEVVEALDADRYRLTTRVLNDADEEVIDGEAVVLIDDLGEVVEAAES